MRAFTSVRVKAIISCAIFGGAAAVSGQTPCVNCAPGTVVNSLGVPDAAGQYLWYPNHPNGQSLTNDFWACSITMPDGTRRRIHLGDPTVLKIGDYYYLTGSSDVARTINFPVYKSHDLVNWKPHMLAFGESYAATQGSSYDNILTGGATGWETLALPPDPLPSPNFVVKGWFVTQYPATPTDNIIGARSFTKMFAPQLYVDPSDACNVYLTFHAQTRIGSQIVPPTVFTTSISLKKFIEGGQGNTFNAPSKLGYIVGNSGPTVNYDGGAAATRKIPTSGPDTDASGIATINDFNTGTAGTPFWSGGPGFLRQGRAEWMAIDPFVYFDAADSGRRWMLYTWFGGSESVFGGNNVAGHPMFTNTLMDANASPAGTRFFAYRYHQWYWPYTATSCSTWPSEFGNTGGNPRPVWNGVPETYAMFNGMSNRYAERISSESPNAVACATGTEAAYARSYREAITEAPAVFRRGTTTHLIYSRNFWSSPAYGMFYRSSTGTLQGMATWINDSTTAEYPLVTSWDRQSPGGPSFGHGEVFAGPTAAGEAQQYYLVCHLKLRADPVGGLPDSYLGRFVTFKRLSFDVGGYAIHPLSNYPPGATDAGSFKDMNGFIVPRFPQ